MTTAMTASPIVITVYNRLEHFKRSIDSLVKAKLADYSEIYIVSDAPLKEEHIESVEHVRDFVRTIDGFAGIQKIFRTENIGAFRSGLGGINQALEKYDRFIFLEDDIIVAPDFLEFINGGLAAYERINNIFSISGYMLPIRQIDKYGKIILLPTNCPWGFGSWRDRWMEVDFEYKDRFNAACCDRKLFNCLKSNGDHVLHILRADSEKRIEAADVRIAYHQCVHRKYTIYPTRSKVINIGLDGTGLHSGLDHIGKYRTNLDQNVEITHYPENLEINKSALKLVRSYYNGSYFQCISSELSLRKQRFIKIIKKLKNILLRKIYD